MKQVTIAIDPQLRNEYGHEIVWTWKYLLSGMGFCWNEVPEDYDNPDILYLDEKAFIVCRSTSEVRKGRRGLFLA